jgi:hypothetical protein
MANTDNDAPRRAVGRPPGPESAKQLLKQELKETIKLNKEIRQMVQDQMDELRKMLRGEPSLDQRLRVVTVLGKMIELQGKGLDAAAGHLVDSENTEAIESAKDTGPADTDAFLKSLQGGG